LTFIKPTNKGQMTDWEYTYVDHISKKEKDEWRVVFKKGIISIINVYNITRLTLNFPETEQWTYENRTSTYQDDCYVHGALIKGTDYTLTIEVCKYVSQDDPDEAYILASSKTVNIEFPIPYELALDIIEYVSKP